MTTERIILIGALTSKPYAFTARPWELKSIETIDLFDSLGSNIRVDIRGSDIMRILPITNDFVNEEWISDKTRHAYDSLRRNRFITPMIKKNNFFIQSSWKEVFSFINEKIKRESFENVIIRTGNYTDLETLTLLKDFSSKLNNVQINPDNSYNSDLTNYYTIQRDILQISKQKVFIIIGSNLRFENPILNIRLKKLSQLGNVLIGYIGSKNNNTINCLHLGNNILILKSLLEGKNPFCNTIQAFFKKDLLNTLFKNKISLLLGNEFFLIKNSTKLMEIIHKLNNFNYDLNVLKLYTGIINTQELGLSDNITINKKSKKIFYLINAENLNNFNQNDFVIFQGHHNIKEKLNFDVILPSTTWVEKSSSYMNCFGDIQKSEFCIIPPKEVRTDWKILKILALCFGIDLGYSTIDDIHDRMLLLIPNFMDSINVYYKDSEQILNWTKVGNVKDNVIINNMPFKAHIDNFYQITSVDKSSRLMQLCTEFLNQKKNNFLKI